VANFSCGLFGGNAKKQYLCGLSTFSFGIGAVPVVTYGLTDHLVLFTYLNFLDVHFTHTSSGLPDADRKTSINNYGLGADANALVTLGAISIGAIWQF
jgi:hypothetical protein